MQSTTVRVLLVGGRRTKYNRIGCQLNAIKHRQFELIWCEQADDCAQLLASDGYHLVLLCSDDEAAHPLIRIIRDQGTVPVIALIDDDQLGLDVLHHGAFDYLSDVDLNSQLLERSIRYVLDRFSAEQRLTQLQLQDPLTGIANRQLFRKNLESAIDRATQQQQPLAVLLINLDGFKKINETYGHGVGDDLVVVTANRLSDCVKGIGVVARIGADEFTLIINDFNTDAEVALVAQKVVDVLSAPFTVENSPFMVSCSVGVAIFPRAGSTVDGLLLHASMAMTQAKKTHGCQYCFYNKETNLESENLLRLESDLRRAIRNNEFELFYQPRVNLETGVTDGVEALIRWRSSKRGLVSPMDFIPLAEKTGLIVPIGYWVIQQACRDMVKLDSWGYDNLDVAVNLSFRQLQDEKFVETVTRIIQSSGIDATRLEFELTETAVMSNYQQTYEGMIELSKLGVTFSLDDFGTGFSSFAHIQRLPISALKIDQSFVRNVTTNEDDAVIVKAIINLAHSLKLDVIGEGVETLAQVQFMWQNGCDQVQGFYYSPALALNDLGLMIGQRATVTA